MIVETAATVVIWRWLRIHHDWSCTKIASPGPIELARPDACHGCVELQPGLAQGREDSRRLGDRVPRLFAKAGDGE